jgi:hypothetical protein
MSTQLFTPEALGTNRAKLLLIVLRRSRSEAQREHARKLLFRVVVADARFRATLR